MQSPAFRLYGGTEYGGHNLVFQHPRPPAEPLEFVAESAKYLWHAKVLDLRPGKPKWSRASDVSVLFTPYIYRNNSSDASECALLLTDEL